MSELVDNGSADEVSVVIVEGQRAGTSTGMTTKMEQSDLSFALNAGHGESPRMVVAPADVADCYRLMVLAFNMAERYQMPVIFLTDQSLTARVESVDRSNFKPLEIQGRIEVSSNGASSNGHIAEGAHSYARYAYT